MNPAVVLLGAALLLIFGSKLAPNFFEGIGMNSLLGKAEELLARFEGFSPTAYKDDLHSTTNVIEYSIGYGHQIQKGEKYYSPSNPSGTVKSISLAEGRELLRIDMQKAVNCVNGAVKVSLTSNQRNALISLAYNIGCGAFQSSTLVRKLNAGDYSGAAAEFQRWIYAEGRVNQALVDRRAIELQLFNA